MDNITSTSIIKAATSRGWTEAEPIAPFTWAIETYLFAVQNGGADKQLTTYYMEAIEYMNAVYLLMCEAQVYVEIQRGTLQ